MRVNEVTSSPPMYCAVVLPLALHFSQFEFVFVHVCSIIGQQKSCFTMRYKRCSSLGKTELLSNIAILESIFVGFREICQGPKPSGSTYRTLRWQGVSAALLINDISHCLCLFGRCYYQVSIIESKLNDTIKTPSSRTRRTVPLECISVRYYSIKDLFTRVKHLRNNAIYNTVALSIHMWPEI